MDTILLGGLNTWVLVKAFSLVLLGMYLIFSLVIVRQAKLMMDTLKVDSVTLPKTLAYLHLAFAVLVFLTAIVVL
jgi:uncharacterized membrane protein (DUF485 family)